MVAARPAEDAHLRPVPWRRMAWVTWRQHRFTLTGVTVFLGALAVYVWFNGLQLHHAYAAAAACHPAVSLACRDLISGFRMASFLANGFNLQAVPALIGVFAGAPVLAREMETGTFRYAWTQGFGRWRWTLAKLIALAVAATAAAAALSILLSWYYQPLFPARSPVALFPIPTSTFAAGLFDLRGVAFAAWTLAAVAIGALAGLLIRRVVPAMAATLVGYAGLAFAAGLYLRQHYLTPVLTRNLFGFFNPPTSAFIVRQWWTKGGTTLSQSTMNQIINSTFQRLMPVVHSSKEGAVAAQKQPTNLHVFHFLIQHGYSQWTRYQPANRFWPFQWIESGWLLALSVLLVAATIWLVRRRAA
jgi:ABC-type transport system involved in multi-copper enzyme maturation permease subunit